MLKFSFSVTKPFQSWDLRLRRIGYLVMKSPSSDELTNSHAAYFVIKERIFFYVSAFSACYSIMIYNMVFNYGVHAAEFCHGKEYTRSLWGIAYIKVLVSLSSLIHNKVCSFFSFLKKTHNTEFLFIVMSLAFFFLLINMWYYLCLSQLNSPDQWWWQVRFVALN